MEINNRGSKNNAHALMLGLLWTLISAFPAPPRIIITTAPPEYHIALGVPFPWLGFALHRDIFTFSYNWIFILGILNCLFWIGIFSTHFASRNKISYALGILGLIITLVFTLVATTSLIALIYYAILLYSVKYIKIKKKVSQ